MELIKNVNNFDEFMDKCYIVWKIVNKKSDIKYIDLVRLSG